MRLADIAGQAQKAAKANQLTRVSSLRAMFENPFDLMSPSGGGGNGKTGEGEEDDEADWGQGEAGRDSVAYRIKSITEQQKKTNFNDAAKKMVRVAMLAKVAQKKGVLKKDRGGRKRRGGRNLRGKKTVRFLLPEDEESKPNILQEALHKADKFLLKLGSLMEAWELFSFPTRFAMFEAYEYRFLYDFTVEMKFGPVIDAVTDCSLLIEILLQFLLSYFPQQAEGGYRPTKRKQPGLVLIHRLYADFIPTALLPWCVAALTSNSWIWRASTLPRLIRIKRLFKYLNEKQQDLSMNANYLMAYKFTLTLFMSLHWVGCFCFSIALLKDLDETTWPSIIGANVFTRYHPSHASELETYVMIMYKAVDMMTLTGVYFSPPNNSIEVVMACIVSIVQIFLSSYIFGSLFHLLVFKDHLLEEHTERLDMLERFCKQRGITQELRLELLDHFNYQYQKNRDNHKGANLNLVLPDALEQQVAECAYNATIERCMVMPGAPFRRINQQFMRALAPLLQEEYCRPGELLIQQGDMSFQLSLLMEGELIAFEKDREIQKISATSGTMPPIVGELAFFVGTSQPYTVRVTEERDAHCLVLLRETYMKLMDTYPEQHLIVVENIVVAYGLDRQGNELTGAGAAMNLKEDDEQESNRMKTLIKDALWLHNTASLASIMDAAVIGDSEEVMRVVRMGFDINAMNYDGQTVLHLMARQGHYKEIEVLLREGADPNMVDRWGATPLQEAVKAKQENAVNLLVSWGSTIPEENSSALLCKAAAQGDVDSVTLMVKNGIDPNVSDFNQRTALHMACSEGHQQVVTQLLRAGARSGAKDRWGGTPLEDAIKRRQTAMVHRLREGGIALEQHSSADLLCSAAGEGDLEQLKLLWVCDADLDAGDYDSRTALMLASAESRLLCVHYLLHAGASPNCTDRWGGTALNDAVRAGNSVITRLLVGAGAELGAVIPPGCPPTQILSDKEITDMHKSVMAEKMSSHRKYLMQNKVGLLEGGPAAEDHLTTQSEDSSDESDHEQDQYVKEIMEKQGSESSGSELVQKQHQLERTFTATPASVKESEEHCEEKLREMLGRTSLMECRRVVRRMMSLKKFEREPSSVHDGRIKQFKSARRASVALIGVVHHVALLRTELERYLVTCSSKLVRMRTGLGDQLVGLVEEADLFNTIRAEPQPLLLMAVSLAGIIGALKAPVEEHIRVETPTGDSQINHLISAQTASVYDEIDQLFLEHHEQRDSDALGKKDSDNDEPTKLTRSGSKKSKKEKQKQKKTQSEKNHDVAKRFQSLVLNMTALQRALELMRDTINTLVELQDHRDLVDDEDSGMSHPGFVRPQLSRKESRASVSLCTSEVVIDTKLLLAFLREFDIDIPRKDVEALLQDALLNQSLDSAHVGDDAHAPTTTEVARQTLQRFQRTLLKTNQVSGTPFVPLLVYGSQLRRLLMERAEMSKDEAGQASSNLQTVVEGLNLVENIYNVFVEEPFNTVKRRTIELIQPQLGEFGAVIYQDLFPLQDMTMDVPKSVFYHLLVMYAEGLTPGRDDNIEPEIEAEVRNSGQGTSRMNKRLSSIMRLTSKRFNTLMKEGEHSAETGIRLSDSYMEGKEEEDRPSSSSLPEGYIWKLKIALWWWTRLGRLAHLLIGNFLMDAWLMPAEVISERFKMAYITVLGDVTHAWELNPLKSYSIVKLMLSNDPLTKRPELTRFWIQTFDPDETGELSWYRVLAMIQDSSERRLAWKQRWGKNVLKDWRIMPDTWLTEMWSNLMRMVAFLIFVLVPIRFVFHGKAWIRENWYMEVMISLILVADVVMKFNCAFVNENGTMVQDFNEIKQRYFHNGAQLDILASLPLELVAHFLEWDEITSKVVMVIRLLTVYRVMSTSNVNFQTIMTSYSGVLLLVLLACIHVFSCCWFWMGDQPNGWYRVMHAEIAAEFHGGYEDSDHNATATSLATTSDSDGPESYGFEEGSTITEQYLLCFYWVFNIIISHGMVDFVPITYPEALFTIFLLILNLTVISLIMGQVSRNVMQHEDELSKQREDNERVLQFINSRKLPTSLASDIKRFYYSQLAGKQVDVRELYSHMSFYLRVKVAQVIGRDTLNSVQLLAGCSPSFLDVLAVLLQEVNFANDQAIFNQDEVANELYILVNGSVTIINEDEMQQGQQVQGKMGEATHLGKSQAEQDNSMLKHEQVNKVGDVIGELSFFFQMPHIYSARTNAETTASMLSVQREAFKRLLVNFQEDENIIAENCLMSYDKHKSQTSRSGGSQSGYSDHSGGSHASGVNSEMRDSKFMGGGAQSVASTTIYDDEVASKNSFDNKIKVLRRKRSATLLMKLCEAARRGAVLDIKSILTGRLIQVNRADSNMRTALSVAAAEGRLEACKLLLERGADPNVVDSAGNTPLFDAVRHRHNDVAEVIFEAGGQLKLDGARASAHLCHLVNTRDHDQIRSLVHAGLSLQVRDADDRTALHLAASEGLVDEVNLLLELGADIKAQDRWQGTPLDDAVREGRHSAMKALIEGGAKLEGMAVAVRLCEAGAGGDLPLVQLLVNNGADPNKGDYDDRTCLHLAASNGRTNIITFLMSIEGIELNPVDRFGGTPLDDAYRHNHYIVITMLQVLGGGMRGNDMEVIQKTDKMKLEAKVEQRQEVHEAAVELLKESVELQALLEINQAFQDWSRNMEKLKEEHELIQRKLAAMIPKRKSYFTRRMSHAEEEEEEELSLSKLLRQFENAISHASSSNEIAAQMMACISKFFMTPTSSTLKPRQGEHAKTVIRSELATYAQAMVSFKAFHQTTASISALSFRDTPSPFEDSVEDMATKNAWKRAKGRLSPFGLNDPFVVLQELPSDPHAAATWILETGKINPMIFEEEPLHRSPSPHLIQNAFESYEERMSRRRQVPDTPYAAITAIAQDLELPMSPEPQEETASHHLRLPSDPLPSDPLPAEPSLQGLAFPVSPTQPSKDHSGSSEGPKDAEGEPRLARTDSEAGEDSGEDSSSEGSSAEGDSDTEGESHSARPPAADMDHARAPTPENWRVDNIIQAGELPTGPNTNVPIDPKEMTIGRHHSSLGNDHLQIIRETSESGLDQMASLRTKFGTNDIPAQLLPEDGKQDGGLAQNRSQLSSPESNWKPAVSRPSEDLAHAVGGPRPPSRETNSRQSSRSEMSSSSANNWHPVLPHPPNKKKNTKDANPVRERMTTSPGLLKVSDEVVETTPRDILLDTGTPHKQDLTSGREQSPAYVTTDMA